MTLQTAWKLAVAWYHDRLSPAWERAGAADVRALFASLGLTGPAWDLSA